MGSYLIRHLPGIARDDIHSLLVSLYITCCNGKIHKGSPGEHFVPLEREALQKASQTSSCALIARAFGAYGKGRVLSTGCSPYSAPSPHSARLRAVPHEQTTFEKPRSLLLTCLKDLLAV